MRKIYSDFDVKANRMSTAAYYRISIPEILSNDINKAVYLDCDLVIESDILLLNETDLRANEALAAVEDISKTKAYKTLGIPPNSYFNSGVMLINLAYWRKHHTAEKVRTFKIQNANNLGTHDQCALNGVLRDKWKGIPPHWNQQSGIYRKRLRRAGVINYSKTEMQTALETPSVIHYVGERKPWNLGCPHPLRHRYENYRSAIDTNFIPPTNLQHLKQSIKNKQLRHYIIGFLNRKKYEK